MASSHRADAADFLDERGYAGPLVRGVNPLTLIDKPLRDRITESYYWKEQCFGLNAATLCDRAVELTHVGGTSGIAQKPTPFLCLLFKLLQLHPERDVVLEYLNFHDAANKHLPAYANATSKAPGATADDGDDEGQDADDATPDPEAAVLAAVGDFKYLRALAAFYVRLTFEPADIYKTLEPLLCDYRKLKRRKKEGFALTTMDQFVDDLLVKERVCGVTLWKLPARTMLEDMDLLEERISPLAAELDDEGIL
ncbi:hypothetical protein KEM52_006280 [Ascosphaera acerosa]|nr:hypothetical protein KEM52_006280 [Ascosphaera acerosa]